MNKILCFAWCLFAFSVLFMAGCADKDGGGSGSATVTSLILAPNTASVPVTGFLKFSAIATFSDGTARDVTEDSTTVWTAANVVPGPAIATVSNTAGTKGVAIGNAVGQSLITASFGGLTSSPATLTVNAATSVSFVVRPTTASIPVTGIQQFAAIETFSDGSTFDRTTTSFWSTSGASAADATVGATTGLAVGVAVTPAGVPVVINATFTPPGGTAKVATPANLTVGAATSVSFVVQPATATITTNGGTQQFVALETFSDGSTIDRTAASTWTALDRTGGPGVATVSNTAGTKGLATGAALGTSTITASFLNASGTTESATAILTVTAPVLGPAGSAGAVNLKSAAPFGIIAFDAITVNAASHIFGDVALTGGVIASVVGPGTKDSGVAPHLKASAVTNSAGVTPGEINTQDNGTLTPAQLTQLQADLNSVFLDLLNRPAPVTPLTTIASAKGVPGGTFAAATDLSGYVLSPGIYTSIATYALSDALGPVVLDAGGNPDALFIIRSTNAASGLTSTTGSVVLQNGAQAKNVFWVVENITIGANTFFQGTIVAGHVITLDNFATVEGRTLAGARGLVSGAITLSGTNVISVPK